jgi:outer membrane receptor protein involved in Fe transport
MQWIGESTVRSNYFINEEGLMEASPEAELQQLSSALVLNANLRVYTNKFSMGASIFNLTNKEYYLPSAINSTQRQRAEGRMIYFSFSYFFNR